MTAHDPTVMIQRLEHALQAKLSPEVAAQGARLVKRLKGPVHIAVIGRAGSGKSRLAELLSQQADLPIFEVFETTMVLDLVSLRAAATPADIVLWCCQDAETTELALWSKLEDVIKDHVFLVLTKADLLAAQGELNATMESLQRIADEEFHSLIPLATLQAIAANGANDTAAFRTSGAAGLKAALRHLLALDRGASRDSATLFLDRYENFSAIVTAPPQPTKPLSASIWADPLVFLQKRADGLRLAQSLPLAEKIRTALEHCCDTAEGLADLMGQTTQISTEDSARLNEVLAVADTTVLLRLEGTASAATDALALLLQLRRDFAQWSIS